MKPNIIVILTDDHGPWALGCAGNGELETPNLDSLAASGMRMDNFFCTSPVCSPARASLLTGTIPSRHGVHDWLAAGNTLRSLEPRGNGELIEYLAGIPGYTDYLSAAGYVCGMSGKWHMGDSHHPQKGFTYWNVHAKGGGPYYNAPMADGGGVREQEGYITDVITDNALSWLDTVQGGENPFYLSVHYTAPHSPWEREHHPAETFNRYFNECSFSSVPDGLEAPEWVQFKGIPVENAEKRREYLSGYFTAITEMDRNVGKILTRLDEYGLRENTLVVFTADNGMNMGHHGVYGKGNATYPLNMFEESVKIPFIISHPGRITPGTVNSALLSQYDFMPTLLDYVSVGTDIGSVGSAAESPGRSFSAALTGGPASGNEHVVVFDEYGPVRMVRTERWKYVKRFGHAPDELFDLKNDPLEERDVSSDTGYAGMKREMGDRMIEWFDRYGDPERDGTKEAVSGWGQLGLCGKGPGSFRQITRG